MIELTGKVLNVASDHETGKYKVTFEIDENQTTECKSLKEYDQVSVRVFKLRPKRSAEANKYMWYLCNELAESLSAEHVKHTKDDIYKKVIQEFGVYDEEELDIKSAIEKRKDWESKGTGWITEQVDYSEDGESLIIRFYYGTSTYNTKQMARVIDALVQDCEAVGIDVKPPEELNKVKFSWKSKNKSDEKER